MKLNRKVEIDKYCGIPTPWKKPDLAEPWKKPDLAEHRTGVVQRVAPPGGCPNGWGWGEAGVAGSRRGGGSEVK